MLFLLIAIFFLVLMILFGFSFMVYVTDGDGFPAICAFVLTFTCGVASFVCGNQIDVTQREELNEVTVFEGVIDDYEIEGNEFRVKTNGKKEFGDWCDFSRIEKGSFIKKIKRNKKFVLTYTRNRDDWVLLSLYEKKE